MISPMNHPYREMKPTRIPSRPEQEFNRAAERFRRASIEFGRASAEAFKKAFAALRSGGTDASLR